MSTEEYNWLSTSRQTQSLTILTLSLLEDFAYLTLKQNYGNCILNKKKFVLHFSQWLPIYTILLNGAIQDFCQLYRYA